ncbi:MAG TPA: FecR domain-containing protein, partial [Elusimicrobiota bacterium]|nr:FecR domain-containing protein [Elusimicrobiota bacterium]
MRRVILIVAWAALARGASAAVLREASGLVQVRVEGSERWSPAGRASRPISPGDSVRTGFHARAVIALDGGAVLEAGGNTQVSLDETAHGGVAVNLVFGAARLSARALGGRPLELRTPTAVSRARSENVSWRGVVGGGGNAIFEVEDGLVGVEDSRGGALRLRAGER